MKNLDLSTYGVEEMNGVEMKEVDGGGIIDLMVESWGVAGKAAGCIVAAMTSNNEMVRYHDVCR